LSKDVDVALWLDYRAFNGDKPVKDAPDFVIVNSELHNEFDSFKKSEVPGGISFIETNPLLQLFCQELYLLPSKSMERPTLGFQGLAWMICVNGFKS
jgi:hypothetical protein